LKRFRLPYDHRVAHVDLNNTSLKRLRNRYLDRRQFAGLIDSLSAMRAAAQVFDFVFAAPLDPDQDRALIQATRAASNVYFGLALEIRQPGRRPGRHASHRPRDVFPASALWRVTVQGGDTESMLSGVNPLGTFPELAIASRGQGSLSIRFDRDGVLRRAPLLVRCGNAFCPLLPFRAVCDYLGVPPQNIILKPGRYIELQNARKPGESAAHDIRIPIDDQGNVIINYIGPWGSMAHYGFSDVLLASDDRDEQQMWTDELKGKILVVADVSTASTDIGPVPTDPNFPLSGMHASIINSILTEFFLKDLYAWQSLIVDVLLAVVLLFLSRFSSLPFSVGTVSLAVFYMFLASTAFLIGHQIWPILRPLMIVGLSMAAVLSYNYFREERQKLESQRQRDFVRHAFGRYLSREVVEELLNSPQGLEMTGEIREVTFLVSDLRGFTSISSELPPQKVIEIMNRYFEQMVKVIARYRGTVNMFMGDGILAFFGAPLRSSDDPQRAVSCAIEMQNALTAVNEEQRRRNLPELAMGIGINTGDVVVGNVGSELRTTYTAVGSPINITYRIESYTMGGQILISPSTHAKIRPWVEVRDTCQVQFKGIAQPITLYEVLGIGDPYSVFLPPRKTVSLYDLAAPLLCNCFLLEDKFVRSAPIPGHVVRLGKEAADVVSEQPLPLYANVLIRFLTPGAKRALEAYAKVIPTKSARSNSVPACARLQFTRLPARTKAMFAEKLRVK